MKRFLFPIMLLFVACSITTVAQSSGGQTAFSTMVRYNDTYHGAASRPTGDDVDDVLARHSATLQQAHPKALTEGVKKWYLLECASCDPDQLTTELLGTGSFETVLINGYETSSSDCGDCPNPLPFNDPILLNGLPDKPTPGLWQLQSIGADCAWSLTDNSKPKIKIAVVDIEFDATNTDLAANCREVWRTNAYPNEIGSHGTNIASLIGSEINNGVGIAGACDVCEVDVFVINHTISQLPACGASSSFVGQGVQEALERGYKIINLSWTLSTWFLRDYGPEAEAHGAILVISAGGRSGDSGEGAHNPITDAIPGIMVVGVASATTSANGGRGNFDVFPDESPGQTGTDYSAYVDVLAPGRGVWRAQNINGVCSNGKRYNIGNGGSLAVPLVASAIGMVSHSYPCLSPSQMDDIIKASASGDCLTWYDNDRHGGGLLNIPAAIEEAGVITEPELVDVIIDGNESWTDQYRYFNSNVIVAAGGNLVVQNSTLRFAPGYGIVVKENGNLTGFNSTFQHNECEGEEWSGISTDGSDFLSGNVTSAPGVYLNGCTVYQARHGLRNYGYNPFVSHGGEITSLSNRYINCRTGIGSFLPTTPITSEYDEFLLDDDYPFDASQSPAGVELSYGAVNVVATVASSTFTDERSDKSDGATAVEVFQSSFDLVSAVDPYQTTPPVRISGFQYGVVAHEAAVASHLAEVRGVEIEDSHVGIWLSGYNNPLVVSNTIGAQSDVPYTDRFGAPLPVQGIRMEHCRRHVVEGNDITGNGVEGYGIVVMGDQLSATRDVVYDNTLNQLEFGMWSEGTNQGTGSFTGLCYECNTFNDCISDIESAEGATIGLRQRGLENGQTASAGNVFGSTLMQFASRGIDVLYYRITSTEEPNPRFRVNPTFGQNLNSCLPILGEGIEDPIDPEDPCGAVTAADQTVLESYRQPLANYYQNGIGNEDAVGTSLQLYNYELVTTSRKIFKWWANSDCDTETGWIDWPEYTLTYAPYQPLDDISIDAFLQNYLNAIDRAQLLANWIGQAEVDALQALLQAQWDADGAVSEPSLAALMAYVPVSELNHSYAQALVRARLAAAGQASFEPLLSPRNPMTEQPIESRKAPAAGVQASPFALSNVTLVDVTGRTVGTSKDDELLTPERLRTWLAPLPAAVYYLRGVDVQGRIQTIAYPHVR